MNRLKRVLTLAVAGVLMSAGIGRAELTDDLVSYWPLDDSFADVWGPNDGVLMGTDDNAVFDAGQFGGGIVLDGIDQFIEIQGEESDFDFVDQDFSISAWFRVDAFTKDWQALIAKGEGNRWRVHRRGGEQIMTWNGGNADVPQDPFGTNFPVDDGELHHFVGVSTADEVLMYIDGELASVGPAPLVENNDMPVMIGENPDARGRTWDGLIDDVAIWGRALDETEVSQIWNGGLGRPIIGEPPAPRPNFVGGENMIGSRIYVGDQSNNVLGPVESGVSGWRGRIVTFDEHGITLNDHSTAVDVLNDFDGETAPGAYATVDLAGGGGTFPDNRPYPNGVADASQDDFVVEMTADVTIPAGTWTIGFGSDDGGRVQIAGVEFLDSLNNDNFEDDEIRFDGNRGHAWTVGTFELGEDLETTVVASFHERGGGDSFEIAVIEGDVLEAANPGTGWELLGDGTLGWSVKTEAAPLVSADLNAVARSARPLEFDVNGDTGEADQLSVENPDPNVFTTILDVDGLTFQIKSTGTVSSGEAFQIVDADVINGAVTITSVDGGQNWVWDPASGRVCLDTCPPIGPGGDGDFNGDGVLDATDLDLLSQGQKDNDAAFDLTGDGMTNIDDRNQWINVLKNTWAGDANLDGEFNSGDFVAAFTAGRYETGQMAGWAEGDWNGDMAFDSGDFVYAFSAGGYEQGPRGATAAVPEPSSMVLALLSLLGVVGVARRRNG